MDLQTDKLGGIVGRGLALVYLWSGHSQRRESEDGDLSDKHVDACRGWSQATRSIKMKMRLISSNGAGRCRTR